MANEDVKATQTPESPENSEATQSEPSPVEHDRCEGGRVRKTVFLFDLMEEYQTAGKDMNNATLFEDANQRMLAYPEKQRVTFNRQDIAMAKYRFGKGVVPMPPKAKAMTPAERVSYVASEIAAAIKYLSVMDEDIDRAIALLRAVNG